MLETGGAQPRPCLTTCSRAMRAATDPGNRSHEYRRHVRTPSRKRLLLTRSPAGLRLNSLTGTVSRPASAGNSSITSGLQPLLRLLTCIDQMRPVPQ